jgi:hypothetical protein
VRRFILISPDALKRRNAVGRKSLPSRDVEADAGVEGLCRRFAREAGEMNRPAPLPETKFKNAADSTI